jgi:RNA polymerase sigma-70 factor (ECF subfamily)
MPSGTEEWNNDAEDAAAEGRREHRADFAALLARHHLPLMGYVLTMVPKWSDAEDIVQESMAVMWRKFGQFEQGTSFLAWARQIARFHAMNYLRKQARDRHVFSAEVIELMSSEAEAEVEQLESERAALQTCIEKLDARSRSLLSQCYASGASIKAVAENFRCTPNSVYKSLNRIRQILLSCVRRTLAVEGG